MATSNTISQRIGLEGAEDVKKKIADIGTTAEQTFGKIADAAEQTGELNKNLKPEEATAKLQELGDAGVDALKKIQEGVQSAGRFEGVVDGLQTVGAAFSKLISVAVEFGPAIVGAVALGVKELLSLEAGVGKVNEEAQKLGVAVDKFDALRLGIEAAGISADGFTAGFEKVVDDINKAQIAQVAKDFNAFKESLNISGAGTAEIQRLLDTAVKFTPAGKAAAEALQKLGVGIPGTTARDVEQLGAELAKLKGLSGIDFKVSDDSTTRFNKIVEALQKIPDAGQRAQAALEFLGKAGPEFERAFQTGAIEKFRQAAVSDLGAVSQADAKLASEVEQTQNRITAAMRRWDVSTALDQLDHLSALLLGIAWDKFSSGGQAAFGSIKKASDSFDPKKNADGIESAFAAAWESIKNGAIVALDGIKNAFNQTTIGKAFISLFDDAKNVFAGLVNVASDAWESIKSVFTQSIPNAWQWIVDTFNAAVSSVSSKVDEAKALIQGWIETPLGDAWQWIVDTFNDAVSSVSSKVDEAKALIQSWITTPLGSAWQWIVDTFNAAVSSVNSKVDEAKAFIQAWITTPLGNAWQWIVDTFTSAITGLNAGIDQAKELIESLVTTPIENAWQWIKDTFNSVLQGLGLGGSPDAASAGGGGFAEGGYTGSMAPHRIAGVVHGREYVQPAHVVARPGVLAFMEILRRSGDLPQTITRFVRGFSAGGFVDRLSHSLSSPSLTLPGFAAGGFVPALASGGQQQVAAPNGLQEVADAFVQAAGTMSQAMTTTSDSLERISFDAFTSGVQSAVAALQTSSDTVSTSFAQIADGASELVSALQQAAQAVSDAAGGGNSGGGGGGGFSEGGYTGSMAPHRIAGVVHGREYVQPAHVVARPGVLSFMDSLRRSGGDLGQTIVRFARGFSDGGFVDRLDHSLSASLAVPGFAAGGFVPALAGGGMSHVTIQFPGLPPIGGLQATESRVSELKREAVLAHVRSGGRKPSRYGSA